MVMVMAMAMAMAMAMKKDDEERWEVEEQCERERAMRSLTHSHPALHSMPDLGYHQPAQSPSDLLAVKVECRLLYNGSGVCEMAGM
jgi:hypothetical protein